MPESVERHAEHPSGLICHVVRESGGNRRRDLKNAVHAICQRVAHPCACFFREESLPIEFAAIRKHGVKLRKRRSASDSTKRNNRLRPDSGSIHPADRIRSVWRSKRFACQGAWSSQVAVEFLRLGWPAALGSINGRN